MNIQIFKQLQLILLINRYKPLFRISAVQQPFYISICIFFNLPHVFHISVNKQLGDKERVAAALENSHLLNVVNQCLSAAS